MRVPAAAGADGWRAVEPRALPREFWDRLAEFLGVCEEVGKWPGPLRVGLVALTPRPIVLLPLVYRIWAGRPAVRRWVTGAGADGANEPGRGADEAAWHLALEAECLDPTGGAEAQEPEVLCGVFLDCSKCYERAPLRQLDVRAVAAGFPDLLLVLALDMYSRRKARQGGHGGGRGHGGLLWHHVAWLSPCLGRRRWPSGPARRLGWRPPGPVCAGTSTTGWCGPGLEPGGLRLAPGGPRMCWWASCWRLACS